MKFSINLCALFIQQKMIKIPDSLLNVCKPPGLCPPNGREARRGEAASRASVSRRKQTSKADAESRLGN